MCAKYTIKRNSKDQFINIPLSLTQGNSGQDDMIEHEFVEKEVEKAINGIVDYERLRLGPISNDKPLERVDYEINLLNGETFPTQTTLKSIGFTDDDLKYSRIKYKRSFLNLLFFDTDNPTNQNLLSHNTIYNKTTRFDMMSDTDNTITDSTESTSDLGTNGLSNTVITGTVDDSITEGLFFGQTCLSISDFGSLVKYYINGLSYKPIYSVIPSWQSCADNPTSYVGQIVNGSEVGIPYGLFDTIYLVDSNYSYNGRVYKVYSKWTTNLFLIGTKGLTGVYFVEATPNSDNVVETTKPTSSILYGRIKSVGEIPLRFMVENPISKPKGFAEGYYLYHNIDTIPNSIYMRANYNNAKTGISTDLVTTRNASTVEEIIGKLHTKYDLKSNGDNYYYEIDTEYSDNVQVGEDSIKINLFEIQVL